MKDIPKAQLLIALQVTYEGMSWLDPLIASKVLRQLKHNPKPDQTETGAYPLTKRELEVLELIVQGCSNQLIADKLYVTVGTVKTHVRNILSKLCVDDRAQAAVRALRTGLVP
jgi:DNA-binding NarL/FixJ family response regulator